MSILGRGDYYFSIIVIVGYRAAELKIYPFVAQGQARRIPILNDADDKLMSFAPGLILSGNNLPVAIIGLFCAGSVESVSVT